MSEPVATPAPAPAPVALSTLDKILDDAEVGLGVLGSFGGLINPGIPAVAALLAKVDRIIKKGVLAHEGVSGQPYNPASHPDIPLIP